MIIGSLLLNGYVTQRLCFLAALVVFLEVGILLSKETAAEILGVKTDQLQGFHLDLEDYLMGVLQLTTELSRFAINSVTNGDYDRPLQISRFVAEINAGFRVLNLKNDSLRKRFDVLKYDVKKIEEVVYDLTIRGLKNNQADAAQKPVEEN
ncbi:Translin family [Popillia japonica]|uniref:Translin n=1 Tax=Popillia japonica TaxID=7064 RepID=A0AAW1KFX1_POPJA